MKSNNKLYEEQKKLVLARFKTLNPEGKISFGNNEQLNVKEIINHLEKDDEFAKKIVQVEMKMLKILTTGV